VRSVAAVLLIVSGTICPGPVIGQSPIPVLRQTEAAVQLLANRGFETVDQSLPTGWTTWQKGFELSEDPYRGSNAVTCLNASGEGEYGVGQTVVLNRRRAAPFVIRGWSKARDVTGSPDSGYSLYADIVYQDDTPLWGQSTAFDCGTHGWQVRELVVTPTKPVKRITLYALFRGHAGQVWFDDLSLEEIPVKAGAVLFQGAPVEPPGNRPGWPKGQGRKLTVASGDGLELIFRGDSVSSLRIDPRQKAFAAAGGFLARDVAANSDFLNFAGGECRPLEVKLNSRFTARPDGISVEGELTDTTGRDRAMTLGFLLPFDALGWQWGDDVRRSRNIEAGLEYINTVPLRCGATGSMSRYPLAAVWHDHAGLAIAMDMGSPAQYRIGYHQALKQFYIAYDFGMAPESCPPGSARFRFILFNFDSQWGMRSAVEKFYRIFPGQFVKRAKREGCWMPFRDVAQIPHPEDFGFGFQEGAPNVPFDDGQGIYSFVYVEPVSNWLPMPPGAPRTLSEALKVLENDRSGARGAERRGLALATQTSGIYRENGDLWAYFEKAPWCDGAVFFLNPDPGVTASGQTAFNKAQLMKEQIDAAFEKNRPAAPVLATNADAGLDGVYFDSFEMGAGELNYRREHFGASTMPLVFDAKRRPAQLLFFGSMAFEQEIARELHTRGKLTFANGVLWNYSLPAPWLDVLGTEVNWLPGGKYTPDSDELMLFRRTLCWQKPYCLLMNCDYSKLDPQLVERYMQRCVFYGIWPGFFDEQAASKDPYWVSSRKWYERDRPLFRKYIPILKSLTTAGWQPVTLATPDNPRIRVERFGDTTSPLFYLTLFNDTPDVQDGHLRLSKGVRRPGGDSGIRATEMISGNLLSHNNDAWEVRLKPDEAAVLRIE
jgi:hypothetical protein